MVDSYKEMVDVCMGGKGNHDLNFLFPEMEPHSLRGSFLYTFSIYIIQTS